MTQPDTGVINQQWVVETYANVAPKGGLAVLSSQRLTVVSEAYFLGSSGANQASGGTVVAHGISVPNQGSIAATQAATLAPQQFAAVLEGLGGSLIGTVAGTAYATIQSVTFLERGV